MIFEAVGLLLPIVPVFLPTLQLMGVDLIWFGIVMVVVVEMGLITPPIGMDIFTVRAIMPDIRLGNIFNGVKAFVVADEHRACADHPVSRDRCRAGRRTALSNCPQTNFDQSNSTIGVLIPTAFAHASYPLILIFVSSKLLWPISTRNGTPIRSTN